MKRRTPEELQREPWLEDPEPSVSLFPAIQTCGSPPWNVFLMVNLGAKAVKQTEIRIHSQPGTVELMQNQIYGNNRELWHTVMSIGPFYNWDKVLHFAHAWSQDTRGNRSRIIRGSLLYMQFHKSEKLEFQFTALTKKEAIQELINKMCARNIYGVLFECDPNEYNLEEQGLYIPQEKLKFLTEISGSPEDHAKLAYWSENSLAGPGENLTKRTLAWVFSIVQKKMEGVAPEEPPQEISCESPSGE